MKDNTTKMTSIGKKMYLKTARQELGMTQKRFAEILGIRCDVYRKYEEANSGSRTMPDKLFNEVRRKITQYEREHKGEIEGKIIISRYLEDNRDALFLSLFTRQEREIANVIFHNTLEIIKEIEKRAKVPYLMVRK